MPKVNLDDLKMTVMELAQEQVRKTLETARILTQMIDELMTAKSSEPLERLYEKVLKLDEENKMVKRSIEDHISKAGSLLDTREDLIRLTNDLETLADKAEAAAFRIVELTKISKVNSDACRCMSDLSMSVLTIIEKLRDAVLAVRIDSMTLHKKLWEIEVQERQVDEIFRKADITILRSHVSIPVLLLSREIVYLLEEMADKTEETADILRALFLVS
ncbi:MAG: DUF47 family protein [Aigarchaeota archaeon]|nr:DUF47 family protein [Aigarchaeota archaeon]MDW8092487.1 DUF47 family protein [Nitrososphaerota archaeon]